MPPRELQERLTSREFVELVALESIDPWGPARGDVQAAIIAATVANVHGGKRGGRAFDVADFVPQWGRRRRQTPEEQLTAFRAFAATHNAAMEQRSG